MKIPIPTPISLIVQILKWVWNKITRFWLFKIYKQSHMYYEKHTQLGSHWMKLGEYLEYSLRLATRTDHKSLKSKIAFRSTKETLTSVTLFFEASGGYGRYQQKIELANLDENPIIVTLEQIPKIDLIQASTSGILFTIHEMKLTQCVVITQENHQCSPLESSALHPTHSWLLNDTWKYRWGIFWNCNAIKHAKYEIATYWKWKFNYYDFFYYEPNRILIQIIPRKLLCKILVHPYMLTLQFWLAVHSGRYEFCDGKLVYKKIKNKILSN
ncbi:TPA: hypothetical protein I8W54_002104 [Morganella morganii]|nr:hypothetical protein [Morganella morganii]